MIVSVVIIGYRGDPWLPKCIASLKPDPRHEIQLLLVDNFDTPCLKSLRSENLKTTIIKTPKPLGFAEANNFALVNGGLHSDVVVFLNQDTWSENQWIPVCANLLESNREVCAVTPTIRQYDSDNHDPSFAECLSHAAAATSKTDWQRVVRAPAAALAVRTSTLKTTGPFDPIFGSYYEDYDLCHRLSQHGNIVVSNECWVRHFSGSATTTPEAQRKRMVQIIRNRLIFEARTCERSRMLRMGRYYLKDLPINILRGLLATESSQPIGVTLKANVEILKIMHRLLSGSCDKRKWEDYLTKVRWTTTCPPEPQTSKLH